MCCKRKTSFGMHIFVAPCKVYRPIGVVQVFGVHYKHNLLFSTDDYTTGAAGLNTMISESTGSGTHEVDTMEDARGLYPWPSGLYEVAGRLWSSLSPWCCTESLETVILHFFQACFPSTCQGRRLRERVTAFSSSSGFR